MQLGEEEEVVELVNAVVDGQATPAEAARLELLLASSAEARELFESTRAVAQRLEAMSVTEPPGDLRRSIIDAVRPRARVVAFADPRTRRQLRFAAGWAAAAAIVLVVLLTGRSHMTGTGATMAPPAALQWPVFARIVSSPSLTLIVRREDRLFSLEPVYTGPRPATLVLAWDDAAAVFVGVSDGEGASSGKASVSFRLRDPSQRAGVIVRPRGNARAAAVRVSVENVEVTRAVIPLQ